MNLKFFEKAKITFSEKKECRKGQEKHAEAKKIVSKLSKYKNKPIFEIITPKHKYIRPYFDMELYRKGNEAEFDKFKKNTIEFVNPAIEFIISKLEGVRKEDLAISESKYKDKISFHIIIPNKQILYTDLYTFQNIYKDEFKKYMIDTSVYPKTGYQKFRLIGTSKRGKNSPLKIVQRDNIYEHFITIIHEDDEIINPVFPKDKVIEMKKTQIMKKNIVN